MILGGLITSSVVTGKAYIGGFGEGIVTINGVPAVRQVVAIEPNNFTPIRRVWSTRNGNYVLHNLDPDVKYIVMVYDYKGDYPPTTESHITPYSPET